MCGLFILVEIDMNVVSIFVRAMWCNQFCLIKCIFQLNMYCVNFVIQTKNIFAMKGGNVTFLGYEASILCCCWYVVQTVVDNHRRGTWLVSGNFPAYVMEASSTRSIRVRTQRNDPRSGPNTVVKRRQFDRSMTWPKFRHSWVSCRYERTCVVTVLTLKARVWTFGEVRIRYEAVPCDDVCWDIFYGGEPWNCGHLKWTPWSEVVDDWRRQVEVHRSRRKEVRKSPCRAAKWPSRPGHANPRARERRTAFCGILSVYFLCKRLWNYNWFSAHL